MWLSKQHLMWAGEWGGIASLAPCGSNGDSNVVQSAQSAWPGWLSPVCAKGKKPQFGLGVTAVGERQ